MNAAHTPGPWTIEANRNNSPDLYVWGDAEPGELMPCDERAICTVHPALERGSIEANAALIAAAPDLLAALQTALPMLDAWLNGDDTGIDMNEWDAATMLCRTALAKATGVQS